MYSFLLALFTSVVATLLILRSSSLHAHRTGDWDISKPQGIHESPVPRIGGLAVFVGAMGAAIVAGKGLSPKEAWSAAILLFCAAPAFAAGFVHDLTDSISPRSRLLATCASAGLAYWVLGAAIRHTGLPGLDSLVAIELGAVALTIFTVAGVANSINIVDGVNGLASMCCMLILASICYVALEVNDLWVARMALAGLGAVLGFFLFNFPRGLIFLGDSGAYFLGFYIAEVAILLLLRNPSVSPLFPLLACIYPVFETLFSIYRRALLQKKSPTAPDGIHLHSLVYKRLMRWAMGSYWSAARAGAYKNSMASPILWVLCMLAVVPATIFWDENAILLIFILVFALTYTRLYWQIVRFRTPFRLTGKPKKIRPGRIKG